MREMQRKVREKMRENGKWERADEDIEDAISKSPRFAPT